NTPISEIHTLSLHDALPISGVMVTDRGKSYEADELAYVEQKKCLDHLKRNIDEVLETKTGRARSFGLKLKKILRDARKLWRDQRAGKAKNFQARAEKFEQKLTYHLRHRSLKDKDNQRLLDGIGLQHDPGRVLQFLRNQAVEPTNNRAERAVRPAVIARKLSHGSKNNRGAEAFSAFTSVIQTAVKRGVSAGLKGSQFGRFKGWPESIAALCEHTTAPAAD